MSKPCVVAPLVCQNLPKEMKILGIQRDDQEITGPVGTAKERTDPSAPVQ
jgi:hypothetical protein